MRGQATALIIIAIVIIAVVILMAMSGGQQQAQIVVISNATYNYANTSYNQTTNETIIINNSYYLGGSVTIPFENVTSGTGTGDYTVIGGFEAWNDGSTPSLKTKVGVNGDIKFYISPSTILFETDKTNYYNRYYGGVQIQNSVGSKTLIDFQAADGIGGYATLQNIINYANITYDSAYITDKIICPIVHRGTQQNFTMCINQTGSVIETIGVFPA
jgi:hypothetical protein